MPSAWRYSTTTPRGLKRESGWRRCRRHGGRMTSRERLGRKQPRRPRFQRLRGSVRREDFDLRRCVVGSSAPRLPPDGYSGHMHDFDSATRFERLKECGGFRLSTTMATLLAYSVILFMLSKERRLQVLRRFCCRDRSLYLEDKGIGTFFWMSACY